MNRIASVATAAVSAGLSLAVLGTIAAQQGVLDVGWPSAGVLALSEDDDHEEWEDHDESEHREDEEHEKHRTYDVRATSELREHEHDDDREGHDD